MPDSVSVRGEEALSISLPPGTVLRFGIFELDVRAAELRKAGVKIRLQKQPLQLLTILLQHRGEVVSRDELRRQLWGEGVYVDFDRALNVGVVKLREALGDLADSPRFIETLPRVGYRFIAPVDGALTASAPDHTPPAFQSKHVAADRACEGQRGVPGGGLSLTTGS
jgi:DNA-binding winged helix-turn-helix (wHTH) protein